MIPPEFILETSATMIVGILFIITLAKALKVPYMASLMFLFTLFGIIPFSISAILVLLEYYEAARLSCVAGFVLFTFFLTLMVFGAARNE